MQLKDFCEKPKEEKIAEIEEKIARIDERIWETNKEFSQKIKELNFYRIDIERKYYEKSLLFQQLGSVTSD